MMNKKWAPLKLIKLQQAYFCGKGVFRDWPLDRSGKGDFRDWPLDGSGKGDFRDWPLDRSGKGVFRDWPLDRSEKGDFRDWPLDRSAGSWKHRLFPPPVGMTRRQSRPDIVAFIVCSCMGRNSFIPNTDSNFSSSSGDQGKSAKPKWTD